MTKTGKGGHLVSDTIGEVITRADELAEFLAIYQKVTGAKSAKRLTHQMRKGLAAAFKKFDEYQLAKYDRAGQVRLRDVLFLAHPKPKDEAQAALWKRLAANELKTPDTWEVELSAGKDKKETFERLIRENKLGYLALLRNLRNMVEAGCDREIIGNAIRSRRGAGRVLPFRYVAAARACPQLEPYIDAALIDCLAELPAFDGETFLLVDVSSSMDDKLSARSTMSRMDAAAALAALWPGRARMFTFSDMLVEVPPRKGMAGIDAIKASQPHGGTRLFDAVHEINDRFNYDRLVVITDEQAHPARYGHYIQGNMRFMPAPKAKGYVINVASAKNGVGYHQWTHIDGWSDGVIRYIAAAAD